METFFSLRTDEERRAFVSDWLSKFENQYAASRQNVFGAAEGYKPTAEPQAPQPAAVTQKEAVQVVTNRLVQAAKPAVRQDNKTIHTIVIVDDAVYRQDELRKNHAPQALRNEIARAFGHKRGNDVHICSSYKEAVRMVGRIEGASWTNTFIYADPRVADDGSAQYFKRFIRTKLIAKDDGSILIAAPIFGYSAYSQLYSSFIETVCAIIKSSKSPKGYDKVMKNERVGQLAERMAVVASEMTKTQISKEDILRLVPGIATVAVNIESGEDAAMVIDDFLQAAAYAKQHQWNLPYARAANWEAVRDFFILQHEALFAA